MSDLKQMLTQSQNIAIVGLSDQPARASYQIAVYLLQAGYTIYPVNPKLNTFQGHTAYASLQDIPDPIDIVNIFRRSEAVPPIVDAAIEIGAKNIWMQIGVMHEAAAQTARAAGLNVIMDRCIKVDHARVNLPD